MYWRNALVDGLPGKNEEVIISVRGVNCAAIFHDKEKQFEDKKSGEFYSILSEVIYWKRVDELRSTA